MKTCISSLSLKQETRNPARLSFALCDLRLVMQVLSSFFPLSVNSGIEFDDPLRPKSFLSSRHTVALDKEPVG